MENYILQPTIIGKITELSGFMVLVSVLVFGSLFGIIGAVIAFRSQPRSASSSTRQRPRGGT